MSLYRRDRIWWLYIVHNGEKIRRSCYTANKKAAQQIHDQARADLWQSRPDSGSFYAALDAWFESEPRDPADKNRIDKLKREYEDRSLNLVTAESLEEKLPATTPATFNRYANLVTAVLNFAKNRGGLDVAPRITRRKVPAGRLRWLTKQEWQRLKVELTPHQRAMAGFALATGLRQRNVTHLTWGQIDLGRRVAWIYADEAKAGKSIGIPLSDEAVKILRAQLGKHKTWVFVYQDRAVSEIKTSFSKALKRAGIEGFTWHGLRHTWASWHIMAGTPVEVLQKLGGWADIRMVLRYAHLDPTYLSGYAGNAKPKTIRTQSRTQNASKPSRKAA